MAERQYFGFNQDGYRELKQEYQMALAAGKETFISQGMELMTAYAGYLIEYLEIKGFK